MRSALLFLSGSLLLLAQNTTTPATVDLGNSAYPLDCGNLADTPAFTGKLFCTEPLRDHEITALTSASDEGAKRQVIAQIRHAHGETHKWRKREDGTLMSAVVTVSVSPDGASVLKQISPAEVCPKSRVIITGAERSSRPLIGQHGKREMVPHYECLAEEPHKQIR
jgi:hypothetical protein